MYNVSTYVILNSLVVLPVAKYASVLLMSVEPRGERLIN